ncbi:unnamed protein product [Penicillium camemberti]|uniref:Str. FM013 n=1 Tax=Penicillium camemberti (strain FM 013) TaxID=1429867 RepID=A0A0G4P9Z6_PENC3|nr:unnamed protein product [Penicillium camemberti]
MIQKMPKNFTMKWVYAHKSTRLTNQQWVLFEYPGGASAYYRDVGNEARHLPMHHLVPSFDGLVARHPSDMNWICMV